ncbi:hypothetical protein H5410_060947 [Solanum commersonii]|uniref:Uncharacterized protein n=1 Tax=Solanum commersonii TaxID=4109 RepID=A0A9J5W6E5_SOLCO|nr:hypothetical protein H5410_060947 [Solanum commersonii]
MNDLAEVYHELNVPRSAPNDVYSQVMGPGTHGNNRTLAKIEAPSFVYVHYINDPKMSKDSLIRE